MNIGNLGPFLQEIILANQGIMIFIALLLGNRFTENAIKVSSRMICLLMASLGTFSGFLMFKEYNFLMKSPIETLSANDKNYIEIFHSFLVITFIVTTCFFIPLLTKEIEKRKLATGVALGNCIVLLLLLIVLR